MNSSSRSITGLAPASLLLDRLSADAKHFEVLAQRLRDLAGINLAPTPKNKCLMAARLSRVMGRHGIDSYRSLIELMRSNDAVVGEFVSAMTTNTTQFFREIRHFEMLGQQIPAYLRQRQGGNKSELRIWCAASSSGQEIYTILMTLLEAEPALAEGNMKILATDIDRDMLGRASAGLYSKSDMADVPLLYRRKYFKKFKVGSQEHYLIGSKLRSLVTFAPFNLMSATYPFQHPFDIIFCRNVLIYFDRETTAAVIAKLSQALRPDGLLFVGHSEAGLVRCPELKAESSAIFRKRSL